MTIIQGITSQTSSGTMATTRSVGELNEMAAALQESVTGLKSLMMKSILRMSKRLSSALTTRAIQAFGI